jgi:hypothetical protein
MRAMNRLAAIAMECEAVQHRAMLPRWSRPLFHRTQGSARLSIVTFADQRPKSLDQIREDGSSDGYTWPESLKVNVYDLIDAEQRNLFQPALVGSIRDRAAEIVGAAAARIDNAHFAVHLEGELPDPPDLAHLQGVNAILRRLVRDCGAFAALNETSIEWIDVAALASVAPSPEFSLPEWLGVVLETKPDPRSGRVVHTRGMCQFARPDVMMLGFAEDVVSGAIEVVTSVAQNLAMGGVLSEGDRFLVARLQTPSGELVSAEVVAHVLRPDQTGPDVGLNNDGLIVHMEADLLQQLQASLE